MSLQIQTSRHQLESAHFLSDFLVGQLQAGKLVAWLVPGGSNIEVSVAAMQAVPAELRAKLAILQTDERYGSYDHVNSNWRQLRTAGFDPTGAAAFPVLAADNRPIDQTVKRYAKTVRAVFEHADCVVGQFGIGADGHIAGILPGSVASRSRQTVIGYKANRFNRITMTMPTLARLDAAFAYVFGDSKQTAVQNLIAQNSSTSEQPCQILKKLPTAYLFTDQPTKITKQGVNK
ncbi:MAG: 6-phosphogluconolactonase [Candidatus Saccharimonadales bacterium]